MYSVLGNTECIKVLKDVIVLYGISLKETQGLNWLRVICIRVGEWGIRLTKHVAVS
jgi:hypothetical protein